MTADIHWIPLPGPGRLAVMPRPRGDEWLADELRSLREQGVEVLVSLLEKDEAGALGLADEERLSRELGLSFLSFPIPDHSVPPLDDSTCAFIEDLAQRLRAGQTLAVHCLAGVGRSGLVAISVLIAAGMPTIEAVDAVSRARGFAVPETDEQVRWIGAFVSRWKTRKSQSSNSQAPNPKQAPNVENG
jgi:protein-tyrosine phosphatase